jgi:hypothetical protein
LTGEMQGKSRFADTAFLVEEGDDHGALFAVIHPCRRAEFRESAFCGM